MSVCRSAELAVDLLRMPNLAPMIRAQPFPADLLDLIRIAARRNDLSEAVATSLDVSERTLRAAAIFYLQEMLFFPGADAYRHLGVDRRATRAQMRLHMRWLLQWLHPDHNPDPAANLLAECVISAWRELGGGAAGVAAPEPPTPLQNPLALVPAGLRRQRFSMSGNHRRHFKKPDNFPGYKHAAAFSADASATRSSLSKHGQGVRLPWIGVPFEPPKRTGKKRLRRVISLVLAIGGAVALMLSPNVALLTANHLFGWRMLATSATTHADGGGGFVRIKTRRMP